MTFKQAAIIAAQRYYNFLDRNKKALITVKVSKIRSDESYYYLKIIGRPGNYSFDQVKIGANIFTNEEFRIISYDSEENEYKISVDLKLEHYIKDANPYEVFLISDLKFLVANVEKFYKAYGDKIKLPTKSSNLSYSDRLELPTPSEEQINAINCSLQTPLSYIWGAPGTGKTRFVLSRCVLECLKARPQKKVLIVAPTNNAVEQTLNGILPVLEAAGIDINSVLRLGLPSKSFASKYPECCENKRIEDQLAENAEKLKQLKSQLEKTEKTIALLCEYESNIIREKKLIKYKEEIEAADAKLSELLQINKDCTATIARNEAETLSLSYDLKKQTKEKESLLPGINALTEKINKYSHGLRAKLFSSRLEEYHKFLSADLEILKRHEQVIKENVSKIKKLNSETAERKSIRQTNLFEIDKIKDDLRNLPVQNFGLSRVYFTDCGSNLPIILNQISNFLSEYEQNKPRYKEVKNISHEALEAEKISLKAQIGEVAAEHDRIISFSTPYRMKDCKVIAATIDACIARIIPGGDFRPKHIFLDEAGYCPLVKGVALLTYDAPITMAGDHMQLPPICNMDDKEIEEKELFVSLFCQSSLFLETCVTLPPEQIAFDYLNHNAPCFQNTAYSELNFTYRFGERLASILANDIYSPRFHGSNKHETKIFYIQSDKIDKPKPRISTTEVQNIKNYIDKFGYIDTGIITPYTKQKDKLKSILPPNADILTVHGSQGREWSTVILSVVDTTQPWFTNSLLQASNGKCVLNTAVSRAKDNLILVLDANYWKHQPKQLICHLLKVAKEIKL